MMRTTTTALLAFALVAPAAAQEYTVFLRPATDMAPQIDAGFDGEAPARFRYLEEWPGRRECSNVRPVHREDLADYVAELINGGNHYMIVWTASGHLIKLHGPVSRIGNAVKDVCEAITEHAAGTAAR